MLRENCFRGISTLHDMVVSVFTAQLYASAVYAAVVFLRVKIWWDSH